MAERTSVAVKATPTTPSDAAIERVAKFTREPFVLDGEDTGSALSPGSARRAA